MLFCKPSEYAIRAMTFLAMQPPRKLTGAREISEVERIPMPFLWKILQLLARKKLIRSFKGSRGGYGLACAADKITLQHIVTATEAEEFLGACVLGQPQCSEENACPLHHAWKEIRSGVEAMLRQNSLEDLARVAQRRARRKAS